MAGYQDWITRLSLLPHPEGGFYREVYRSRESIPCSALPERFGSGTRSLGTSIYFMLVGSEISSLHRINQDETWHYYDGAGMIIHIIDPEGNYRTELLGRDPEGGSLPQLTVEAGCLFSAEVASDDSFCLVGCTCSPGFSFDDLQIPSVSDLLAAMPELRGVIERLAPVGREPK